MERVNVTPSVAPPSSICQITALSFWHFSCQKERGCKTHPGAFAASKRARREEDGLIRRFHRGFTATVSVLAGLIWSWLDMKTLTGPENWAATRWRTGAFAVMVIAALSAWSRSKAAAEADGNEG
jgi:hypothetical protein